jgi:hypothetical protein
MDLYLSGSRTGGILIVNYCSSHCDYSVTWAARTYSGLHCITVCYQVAVMFDLCIKGLAFVKEFPCITPASEANLVTVTQLLCLTN